MACSLISQCATVVAAVAWVGHCWAGRDARQHWGVWSPGTGSTAAQSQRAFPGPPPPLLQHRSRKSMKAPVKQLQSRDTPALHLHSAHGLQVNDVFCTEDMRTVCSPWDALMLPTPLQKGQPLCGVPGCAAGRTIHGSPKSLHSPHSYASPANIFTHCVWLKQELPQASQSSSQIFLFAVSKQEWMKTVLRLARVRWEELVGAWKFQNWEQW